MSKKVKVKNKKFKPMAERYANKMAAQGWTVKEIRQRTGITGTNLGYQVVLEK